MDAQRWWLTNAEESQRDAPYTFYRPSPATISKLAVGNQVKLIFEFDNPDPDGRYSAERMWVTITAIEGGRFKGVLDNEPYELEALKPGDPVEFEACNIISTDIPDPAAPDTDRFFARCFVTRKVLYDGEKVGYLYREDPDQENDSGWRIMAGTESTAYMDDSDNVFYVALGAVLNKDDSFVNLLDCPAGSAFELDTQTGRFKTVE